MRAVVTLGVLSGLGATAARAEPTPGMPATSDALAAVAAPVLATSDVSATIAAPASATIQFERAAIGSIAAPPPDTRLTLAEFATAYIGRALILPGYSTAECVALFSAYNADVVRGDSYVAPAATDLWTSNAWTAYDRVPTGAPPQPGDVVVWSGSTGAYLGGGAGHVAVVLQDNGDGTLQTLSQNPNPTAVLTLSKYGVLGYMRPHSIKQ